MALPPPPAKPDPDRIQTEQEVREDLAAAYRLIAPCAGPWMRLSPAANGTDGFFCAVLERAA